MPRKLVKKVAVTPVDPITGSIVDGTNIDDKTVNTYSAKIIDELVKEVYSTEEQVVGTWIDGKPIYRKVIETGEISNSTDENTWNISIASNMKHIVNFNSVILSGSFYFSSPRINVVDSAYTTMFYIFNGNLMIMKGISGGVSNSWHTIEYTKTTD